MGKYVKEKHGSDFFFVNKFPFAAKPFYVMKDDEGPAVGEERRPRVQGHGDEQRRPEGAQVREDNRPGQREVGSNLDNLKWFTEFFKYGAPPHGGFSIGIERLTMQLLNLQEREGDCPVPEVAREAGPLSYCAHRREKVLAFSFQSISEAADADG